MPDEQDNETSEDSNVKEDVYIGPKTRPKIVRVLTVLAYVLSVSMAAILLSVYYIFMWDGQPSLASRKGPQFEEFEPDVLKHENLREIHNGTFKDNGTDIVEFDGLLKKIILSGNATTRGLPEHITNKNFNQSLEKIALMNETSFGVQYLLRARIAKEGEESKDRLYEPKHKKKLIRVLTVVAYVFFVSLAAIMLSLYYVFLWNGYEKEINYHKMKTATSESCVCPFQNGKQVIPPESTSSYEENMFISTTTTEDVEVNTETELPTLDFKDLGRRSLLYKKIFHKKLLN